MASDATIRRNNRARELGYRNYYEQRLDKAKKKHGPGITTSQARGHPGKGQTKVSLIAELREMYHTRGWKETMEYGSDLTTKITRDQWGLIFGSPTLITHRDRSRHAA